LTGRSGRWFIARGVRDAAIVNRIVTAFTIIPILKKGPT